MDKLAAANQLNEFLRSVLSLGGFRLKYRIVVDPEVSADDRDWEKPEILVDLSGPDSTLLLSRNAELLRALELLSFEILHLAHGDHEKISFDCQNHRSLRLQELRGAATAAAEKVRQTGVAYSFAPMSSRERRMVHLALRNEEDLHTQSEDEGPRRHLVVYIKGKQPDVPARPPRRTSPRE